MRDSRRANCRPIEFFSTDRAVLGANHFTTGPDAISVEKLIKYQREERTANARAPEGDREREREKKKKARTSESRAGMI